MEKANEMQIPWKYNHAAKDTNIKWDECIWHMQYALSTMMAGSGIVKGV